MAETLAQWWPLYIAGAIFWAGYMVSSAINAASQRRNNEFFDIRSQLIDIRDLLKWTNDSVRRVEQRLPPRSEDFY